MSQVLQQLTIRSITVVLALAPGAWGLRGGTSGVSARIREAKSSHCEASGPHYCSKADQKLVLGTDLVNLTVTVVDAYGKFVPGLVRDNFQIYDNEVKQEISHFSDEDAPVSVGIVYDISRSMKDRMSQSQRALKRFIDATRPNDDFFLITFNDRASLVQDFTGSGDRILDHLRSAKSRGSTALYDATYLAIEKIQQGRHPKRAILIISDGEDNKSRYTARELRSRVEEADVVIYAIGLTDEFSKDSGAAEYGRFVLTEITQTTGGLAFFPNAYHDEELAEICAHIALELRKQYSIGFYPTNSTQDGKWHKLEVRLKAPRGVGRVLVNHRKGYKSQRQ